jgi:uncharacterized protein (TIGR02145 family)
VFAQNRTINKKQINTEKIMKKVLFFAAICCAAQIAFAQGADVCEGTSYTIGNTVPASSGSTYRWVENGNVIGNNSPTYTVPNTKVPGAYTYVRQSKSADCDEWQSSNEFTVTVFACSFTAGTTTGATATFTDPRDGKKYKTVVMPDGRTWFAQNLNYTSGLTYNADASVANGKQFISDMHGMPAIGSYWCPPRSGSLASGDAAVCAEYGAFYTWETAMMLDGKYSDESKSSSAWDNTWVNGYDYQDSTPESHPNADRSPARGEITAKGGGRGICPRGWHIPTLLEWAIMLDKVEGDGSGDTYRKTYSGLPGQDAGKKLKATRICDTLGTPCDWAQWPPYENTNEFGFDGRATGYRTATGSSLLVGARWCYYMTTAGYYRYMFAVILFGGSDSSGFYYMSKSQGISVRCLADW